MKKFTKVFVVLAVLAGVLGFAGCSQKADPYTGLWYTVYKAELTEAEYYELLAMQDGNAVLSKWDNDFKTKNGYEKTPSLKDTEAVAKILENSNYTEEEITTWINGLKANQINCKGYSIGDVLYFTGVKVSDKK